MSLVQFYPSSDVENTWIRNSGSNAYYTYVNNASDSSFLYRTPHSKTQYDQIFGYDLVNDTSKDAGDKPVSGDTITSVTIYVRHKISQSGLIPDAQVTIEDGAGASTIVTMTTSTTSWVLYSHTFADKPGSSSGGWTYDDLLTLDFGVIMPTGIGSIDTDEDHSSIYIEIDFTSVSTDHPSPTSLECDRLTNPTSGVSEQPNFTAIVQTIASEVIQSVYIEVYEDSGMLTQVGDSGWINITDVTDGNRCEIVEWGNSGIGSWIQADYLKSGRTYYWRIKFRDGQSIATLPILFWYTSTPSLVESAWSTLNTFSSAPLKRQWHLPNYAYRKNLKFNTDHAASSAGLVIDFEFQTGNRVVATDIGCFNEAVQGGYAIESFGGLTHLAFLSRPTLDGAYSIYIVSKNDSDGIWGIPVHIMASHEYDTHFFPVMAIDGDGYIHVCRSSHGPDPLTEEIDKMWYMRSRLPNNSGSLSTDNFDDYNWIRPSSLPTITPLRQLIGHHNTYPIIWYVSGNDRMYVTYRGELFWEVSMIWSDDNGVSWSDPVHIIDDAHAEQYRVYPGGIKYDPIDERLHMSYTYNHDYDDGGPLDTTEHSQGVWYMYSDLNDDDGGSAPNAHGFNVWRTADGTIIGYTDTDPVGNGHSVSADWDLTVSQSIVDAVIEESAAAAVFLTLDINRKPIVFWVQYGRFGVPTPIVTASESIDLACATYSGDLGSTGTWSKNYVSEQLNEILRVGRSGCSLQTDLDGVIHCWYPVGSITYWRTLPTSDVVDNDITQSEISDNYALLDDGFTLIDTTKYVTMSGTSGKMSFKHSKLIPDRYTIIGLEIEATTKRSSGVDGTLNGYLNITGTDYDSATSQSCVDDVYYWFRFYFDENPSTYSAWTTSEINELIFGLKSTGVGAIDICRCVLRIRYTESSNSDYSSNELVYTQSYDNGVTWNLASKSLNSSEGLPIMNNSHRPTGAGVSSICWTSGFKIFYLDNTVGTFTAVRSDCKDLRLFCGDTEIDRVIDYADKNPSKIFFKLQGSLLIDAVYADLDYILYHGNSDETTNALSNPHNIYLYYEGWEQFLLSGVITDDSWVLNSGVIADYEIYNSPPEHNNKVHGGSTSLFLTTGSLDCSKVILSEETNVYAEFALWTESPAGNSMVMLEASGGGRVGVGYTGGSYAGVWDGTVYKDADGIDLPVLKYIGPGQMHEYAMLLTSSGLTAWCDGIELCRDLSVGISTVTKIACISTGVGGTYFDFLRVSNSYEETAITQVFGDNWTWGASEPSSDNTPLAQSWDSRMENLQELMELTIYMEHEIQNPIGDSSAWYRLYVSRGSTYDVDKLVDIGGVGVNYIDLEIPYGVGDVYIGDSFPTVYLTKGTYSFKVDFYDIGTTDHTENRIEFCYYNALQVSIYDPSIVIGDGESHGISMITRLIGRNKKKFHIKYKVDEYYDRFLTRLPITYAADIRYLFGIPTEYKTSLKQGSQLPIDYSQGFNHSKLIPIGYGLALRSSYLWPIEYKSGLRETFEIPVEYNEFRSVDFNTSIEYTELRALVNNYAIEYGLSLQVISEFPLEYQGLLTHSGQFPIAYIGYLTVVNPFSVEYGEGYRESSNIPIDYVADITYSYLLPVEYEVSRDFTTPILVEYLESKGIDANFWITYDESRKMVSKLPLAYSSFVTALNKIAMEYTSRTLAGLPFPLEYTESRSVDSNIPLEYVEGKNKVSKFPISYTVSRSISNPVLTEYLESRGASAKLWVSYNEARKIVSKIPLEYIGFVTYLTKFALEYTSRTLAGLPFPIEYNLNRSSLSKFPTEYTESRTKVSKLPIEWIQDQVILKLVSIEYIKDQVFSDSFPIEYGLSLPPVVNRLAIEYANGFDMNYRFPTEYAGLSAISIGRFWVEYASGVRNSGSIPISYRSTLSHAYNQSIEYQATRKFAECIPIEYTLGRQVSADVSIEYGRLSEAIISRLPIEYTQGTTRVGKIPLSYIQGIAEKYRVPVDYVVSRVITSRIPIEYTLWSETFARSLPIEYALGFRYDGRLPLEYQGIANIGLYSIPIEYGSGLRQESKLPIEYTQVSSQIGKIPIGYLQGFKEESKLPVEYLTSRTISSQFPIAYSVVSSNSYRFPVEYCFGMTSHSTQIPIEYLGSLKRIYPLPIEYVQAVFANNKFPIECTELRSKISRLPIEYNVGFTEPYQLPVEYTSGNDFFHRYRIPIEWLSSFTTTAQFPIEYFQNIRSTATVNVEFLEDKVISSKFLVEYGTLFQQSVNLVTEYLEGKNVKVGINLEYISNNRFLSRFKIEHGLKVVASGQFEVDILISLMASYKIPVEWLGTVVSAMILRYATLKVPSLRNPEIRVPTLSEVLIKISRMGDNPRVFDDITLGEIQSEDSLELINVDIVGGTGKDTNGQEL